MTRSLAIITRIFVLAVLYSALRVLFLINNPDLFTHESTGQLMVGLVHGMRFDLATIAIVNAPFLIMWLIPPLAKRTPIAFAVVNGLLLFLAMGDTEYFQFTGRRLTLSSFAISQDISTQATSVLLTYWYVPLLGMIVSVLLWGMDRFLASRNYHSSAREFGSQFILVLCFVVAARGGWQPKPLLPTHAQYIGSNNIGQLALNSVFTLLKSYKNKGLEELSFFSDEEQEKWIRNSIPETKVKTQKKNIVVIILESFSYEYTGLDGKTAGYTPFLKSLAAESQSFNYGFTNGRRSIDALPAIFAGLPSYMNDPFITSEYQNANLHGVPEILTRHGYETAFFHGGREGTMFFDAMAIRLGFQRYHDARDFGDDSQDDGNWGIYDEPFLQYAADQIDQMKPPFMAGIFTLSSHHPYTVPQVYKDKFKGGPLPIHKSIEYADYALQQFFDKAKSKLWFADTIFILTADHTSKSIDPTYGTTIGRYRVPVVFAGLDDQLVSNDTIVQHVDIGPTILDLLGLSQEKSLRFGTSLTVANEDRNIVLFDPTRMWMVGPNVALQESRGEFAFYSWREDPGFESLVTLDPDAQKPLIESYQRLMQYHNNGLIRNQLGY